MLKRRLSLLPAACLSFCLFILPAVRMDGAEIRRAAEPVKDRYIVTVSPLTKDVAAVAERLAAAHDGKLLAVWKHALKGFWIELPRGNAERLAKDARVVTIETDAVIHTSAEGSKKTGPAPRDGDGVPDILPADPDPLWHLTRISHRGNTPGHDEADYYNYRWGNDGSFVDGGVTKRVKVFVVDTGVWTEHREFEGAAIHKGYNAAGDPDYALSGIPNAPFARDNSPATAPCRHLALPLAEVWHGTEVASLIVGSNIGVAKGVELVPVTTTGCPEYGGSSTTTSAAILIGAFDWVRVNATLPSVVSMSTYRRVQSTGTQGERCQPGNRTCVVESSLTALENAVNAVVDAGIPVIVSANNQDDDACITTPARLSGRGGRTTASGGPARVITVGATMRDDRRWDIADIQPTTERGSNFGQCVDIWAPARHVPVAIPGENNARYGIQHTTPVHTGTSFAAPIVAGVVARMLATETSLWKNVADRKKIVDDVRDRLKANSTILPPGIDNLETASPRELVYLGAVMFRKQLEDVVAPAGSVVNLSVEVVESNVTFWWYRKNATTGADELVTTTPTPTLQITDLGEDDAGEYWVRVKRNAPASPKFYADSRRVRVEIDSCILPKISRQPVTQWVEGQTTPVLTATVAATAAFTYHWERLEPSPQSFPTDQIDLHELGNGSIEVELTDSEVFSGAATYQLVLAPVDACSPPIEVRSDTAQIRRCEPPATPQLSLSGTRINIENLPAENVKPIWYFHPPTTSSPQDSDFQPLRMDIPDPDVSENDGVDWVVPEGNQFTPSKPGIYAVRAGNACGVSALSNRITIDNPCHYNLQGYSGAFYPDGSLLLHPIRVAAGQRAQLVMRPQWLTGAGQSSTSVPLSYSWDVADSADDGTPSRDGRSLLTPPIYGTTDVTVTTTTAWGCTRTLTFRVEVDTARTCSTPLSVTAGSCETRARESVIQLPRGTEITLRANVTEGGGPVADVDTVHFEWIDAATRDTMHDVNDQEAQGNGRRSMLYRVPDYPQRIDVTVTKGGCTDTASIYVEPLDALCETDCAESCPSLLTIVPLNRTVPAGTNVTFTASFAFADATTLYEWRSGSTYDLTSPVIATGKTLSLSNVQQNDVFWCRVTHGGETYDSPFATLVVDCTEVVGGAIQATPPAVRRDERPRLAALTIGKGLQIDWYRRLPGETTNTPIASGLVIHPAINDYITHFGANLTDACGQTGTLEETTVYLCVPTIDVPPQSTLALPGTPVTLTVEATPAIEGQEITVTWHHVSDAWASFPLATGESFTTTLPAGTNSDSFYAALTTDCGGSPNKIKSATATIEYCSYPVIHSYTPIDYITAPGGWARLSVAATGTDSTGADLTYQWYLGETGNTSTPLTGKTQSFLDIAPATTTSYWCRVKSRNLCATDTGTAVVKVCSTPAITAQPAGDRIFPGRTAQLSVVAGQGSNTDPLVHQWQQETGPDQWADIAGANAATYTTPALTADTNYRVRVSAGICEIISDPATIFMCVLPESVSGSEYKIEKNGSVTLALPVMSPVVGKNVVWYRGEPGDISNPVRSGVNVSYTTPQLAATTRYWAEFEYEGCVSRTTAYTVTVCKPTITTPPASQTIQSGQSAPLSVVTTNMAGQSITWYSGALGNTTTQVGTGASINVTPSATTSYWVRVSSCGYNADAAVTVTVCTPPTATIVTPSPRSIRSGQTTSLQTYAPGSNITYQWYVGTSGVTTNPINGQTTDWLQVSPAANTNYWCRITSYGTCVTNGPTITVDVCENPVINAQPLSQRAFSGAATTLTVSASSARPLSYQWYRGTAGDTSNPVSGATSSSVTVTPAVETSYWVRVINGVCSTDSATVTVSMCTFDPSYNGSEVKIGYNETATLSLPAMSPVVEKNVTWYRGAAGNTSTPVRSGINVSYTTPALTATTQYWAEFEYEGCVSRTTTYTVNVCKPAITTQPANKTIQSGQSAPLSITTTSIPGQTITWYSGAAGNTTTPVGTGASINVTPAATTSYWARVSSCGLNADSTAVTITVCTPPQPTIVTPSPRAIRSGQTTSLQTYAPGSNITYQWYVGTSGVTTSPINGQTTDWLQVAPTTNTNYWCKVTSYGTCVTNGPTITVDVCENPTITAQPVSTRSFSGAATTLSVTATSSRPLSYQWYRGTAGDTANPVGGATSASVTVTPATATSYWVRVINGVCSTDSATATVSMCTFNPTYSGSEVKIGYNETATLSLPAMSPVVGKNVWWYRGAVGDKTNLVGSGVNASYTTPALTATTTYWAEFEYEGCYSRTTAYTVSVCKPSITAQPSNKSIASGQSTTLGITTTNIPGQTITWYTGAVGNTTTQAGTGASITVSPASTTSYWARVSSCGLNADSVGVTVSVCTSPTINIVTPSPRYIKSGTTTSLQTYSSSPNVTYQWYVGASGTTTAPIGGQTSDWYQASPATTTSYWCKVTSNGTCVTNGPTITVNVCNLPAISAQPQSQRIFSGSSATLSVTASSPTHALSYQWYRGSTGDTSSPVGSLTTSPSLTVSPTSDTSYWVSIVTQGGACSVNSDTATVSMCTYPAVVPGGSYNIASGQTQTLNLPTMSPVDNKNVTWYQGAVGVKTTPVRSGVNVSYTTPALTATTSYWAEFEHNGCVSRTDAYTVNVCKPTITAQPQSQVIFSGNTALLTVTATGAPLSYQWYRGNAGDTSQPVGTNSSSYTTPALTAGASYWVRVTGCTVADSATATIQVCTAPTVDSITKDPWTSIGGTGSITVSASGTSLSYQWYEGLSGDTTKPISGATSTTYTFNRQTSRYLWVRVTSGCNGAYVNSAATMYSVDPRITQEPQSVTVPTGTSATFSVTATGTHLSYQWYSYTTGLVSGATSNVFTTPALTQETTYYCKVTSGTNGTDYSNYVTAFVCQGPNVPSVSSTQINATTWKLTANVDSWQVPDTRYYWYKGPVGNVAASVFQGEMGNIFYAYNVTSSSTYWVRAMWLDETCYTDRGKSVP